MVLGTILLGLAAVGGLYMALFRLMGNPRPPDWIPPLHGAVAASGVLLLIIEASTNGLPRLAQWALGLFILAAGGGAFIYVRYHRRGEPLPIPFVLGHGVLALTGVFLLILCIPDILGTPEATLVP